MKHKQETTTSLFIVINMGQPVLACTISSEPEDIIQPKLYCLECLHALVEIN